MPTACFPGLNMLELAEHDLYEQDRIADEAGATAVLSLQVSLCGNTT